MLFLMFVWMVMCVVACLILSKILAKKTSEVQEEATVLPLNEQEEANSVLFSRSQILGHEKSVLMENVERYLMEQYPEMTDWYIVQSSLGGVMYPQKAKSFDVVVKLPEENKTVHIETARFFEYEWKVTEKSTEEETKDFCAKEFMKKHAKEFLKKEKEAAKNGRGFFILDTCLSNEALKKLEVHLMGVRADVIYRCSTVPEGVRIDFFSAEEEE